MDPATLKLIIAIIGLVVQYGAPAVQAALEALKKEVITLEDIEALANLVKKPEDY